MKEDAFDAWWNGFEGFHLRSERIYDDVCYDMASPRRLQTWMKICWNAALKEVERKTWDFYWKNEKAGEDLDFLLEEVKTKIS